MKSQKKVFFLLLAIIFLIGLTPNLEMKAESGSTSDPCCRNGYKTWQDVGIFGGGTNFKDCWCSGHKGKNMEGCSCGQNGPNPN